ncbi:MAG: hypothetical protein IBX69_17185 [Anaerolineales bacterium]|nr:hypothetical protein [Anaerolineales bacterium]
MKQNKTAVIIALVATIFLCGFPGLIIMFAGGLSMLISFVPGAQIDIIGSSEPRNALVFGALGCILGLIFLAIPIVIAVLTFRRKPAPQISDEPIPPPS